MSQLTQSSKYADEVYNPIIEAAKPLLAIVSAMKKSSSTLSVSALLDKIGVLIEDFEEQAELNRAGYENIRAAKYCLCTFVDESAVKLGWADESWSQKSLLVTFFNETWGGERFFEIFTNAKRDSDKNLHLLELIYVCLMLGYKGKYQVLPNGDIEIDRIKNELYQLISRRRPNYLGLLLEDETSEQQPLAKKPKIFLPLWVVGVLGALLVGLTYFILQWSLGSKLDRANMEVSALTLPEVVVEETENQDQTIKPKRIAPLLENEIARNLVQVSDLSDRSVVTIMGDGLFESGSQNIQDQYYPVLATVSQALEAAEGQVVVAGYTDNAPIRSMTFPSNWHLSQARADAVKEILVKYVKDENRIRSEGRGENEPVAPNDSDENKAKNRRVEITLFTSGDGPRLATHTETTTEQ